MAPTFPGLGGLGGARYALDVGPELCVGPPGHAYLFGGLTLALALDAAADATGRPAIQAALQFISFTPVGQRLDLTVDVLQSGKTVAQASVTGATGGRTVFQAAIALGDRPGFPERQWAEPPQVRPPSLCPPCRELPPQDANARFLAGIDVRDAGPDASGNDRTRLWLKRGEDAPLDAAALAIFADFVPLAVGRASERAGGGNSLDNALRIVRTAPAGWCLCDMAIPAASGGFAQGHVALWDEAGRLLATGSQTLVMKA